MDTRTEPQATPTLDAIRREAMAYAGIGWFAFGFDGVIRAMDDGAFRLFDLAGVYPGPGAVVGARIEELVRYANVGGLRQKVRDAGRVRGVEWQYTTRSGAERWVVQDAYLAADPDTGGESIQVVLRDVSEARSAQQALRRTETWLWAASEGSHDAFFVLRAVRGESGAVEDFVFDEVNQRAEQFFGLERELLLGQPLCALFPAYREQGVFEKYAGVAETRMFLEEEYPAPLRASGPCWVREQVLAVGDGVAVTSKDVTERRAMEDALRARERRLRLLLEHTPAAVAMLDRDLRYVAHSPRWVLDFGIRAANLAGRSHFEVFPDLPDRWRALLLGCLAGVAARADAERLPRPDGVPEWVRYEAIPWGEREGEVDGVVIFMEVITGRVRAERELRESQSRLRLAMRAARMGAWEWNIESGGVAWSPEMEVLCGLEPGAFGGTFAAMEALVHPDDRGLLRARVEDLLLEDAARPGRFGIEYRVLRPDGRTVWLESNGELIRDGAGRPERLIGVARDVTRRREAEEERRAIDLQLQHTQRLESLGVLAGGIAHDFNNLLTGILGNVDLLRAAPEQPPATARRLDNIAQSARRAADLCRQMLAYAGQGDTQIRRVGLNELVGEMGDLLAVSVSKKAAFSIAPAAGLPELVCDPAQVRQVVLNLVANASEALGDQPGSIRLETGLVHADGRAFLDAAVNAVERPGPFVFVRVEDSGPGIAAAAVSRVFEPFFTTKFAGRGLGLASVLGIVKGHHGALRVDRAELGGARFTVYLPACAEGAAAQPQNGGPTVLLVDDDPAILGVMDEYLSATGLRVIKAADGLEAVRLFLAHADGIGLVVLDRSMPRMDGDAAYREIRGAKPAVPVILTSGYGDDDLSPRFPGLAAFVQKPYQGSELRARIREILGQ